MQFVSGWLQLYGEAIYNTRPFVEYGQGPTKLTRNPEDEWNAYGAIKEGLYNLNAKDVRYTKKENAIYAIQLGWPGSKQDITLETFAGKAKGMKVKSIDVMGSKERIKWAMTDKGLKVTSPSKKPAEGDAAIVYRITLK